MGGAQHGLGACEHQAAVSGSDAWVMVRTGGEFGGRQLQGKAHPRGRQLLFCGGVPLLRDTGEDFLFLWLPLPWEGGFSFSHRWLLLFFP